MKSSKPAMPQAKSMWVMKFDYDVKREKKSPQ